MRKDIFPLLIMFPLLVFGTGILLFRLTIPAYYKDKESPHPESFQVDIQNFRGRIYKGNEVEPATFKIVRPFKEIFTWDNRAILRYSNPTVRDPGNNINKSQIIVEAWVPDEKTEGIFKYSKKVYDVPCGNTFWKRGDIHFQNGIITINYYRDVNGALYFWRGIIIFEIILSIIGIVMFYYFAIRPREDKIATTEAL